MIFISELPLLRLLPLGIGLALALAPMEWAEACGGTFCDAGPTAMPVDQTGETIVFVMGSDSVEAHIRIEYDPDTEAAAFAWLVPVTEVPELSVGSEQLFQNLLAGTVPTYGGTSNPDDCGDDTNSGGGSGAFIQQPDGGGASIECDPVAQDCPDGESCVPNHQGGFMCSPVHFEGTVGAFDVAVLSGTSADQVMQWLGDNGYQQDPAAEPIVAEYLSEGLMFAAFKLSNAAETDTIHPIVLRFPTSTEACIPLRLTRIAAQDDMRVRAFFLGDTRVAPRNWRHVVPNPLRYDWRTGASNYDDAITFAVDEPAADGHAFMTEYAGPSDVVSSEGLFSDAWDPMPFATIEPVDVIDELESQGFVDCINGFCTFFHPLLEGLLAQYLPPPLGVTPNEFYDCLSCYADQIDPNAWDGAAFSDTLRERVVDPGQQARDLLQTWPYLTRLFTTISPLEMTADPFFQASPDLPAAETIGFVATRRQLCNGDSVWTLPDQREVYLPAGAAWPTFTDAMPWAEDIEQVPAMGAPVVEVDNTARIDELLAEYNAQYGWPPSGSDEGTGTSGSGSGSGGSADTQESSGCACRSGTGAPATLALLGGLGLLGLRRRSR